MIKMISVFFFVWLVVAVIWGTISNADMKVRKELFFILLKSAAAALVTAIILAFVVFLF